MKQTIHVLVSVHIAVAYILCVGPAGAESATDIVAAAGVKGGLVVHLGCGDGTLTTELRVNDRYLIHGLDTSSENIRRAREHIQAKKLAGRVSVDTLRSDRLPYVDNMVNLVVAENLGDISMEEVMRVLVPDGVAHIKKDGEWTKKVKPRPDEIDEWTHFLHGPDGNAVAQDSVVGPPFHMQWVGAPLHGKTHSHVSSVNVMVSSGGRLFYIFDESPRGLPHSLPSKWALYARDAFNGITLWRWPLSRWQASNMNSRNLFPVDLHRRLVADGEAVYVTLDIFGPVTQLDAATGETIRVYKGTESTAEIILDDGILYLVIHTSDESSIDRRKMATWRTDVQPKCVMAVRASTGDILWERRNADTATLLPITLATRNGRLYFQNTENVIALDAGTGKELWRSPNPALYKRPTWSAPTLVALDNDVLVADRGMNDYGPKFKQSKAGKALRAELIVLDAKTGEKQWSAPCAEGDNSPVDLFVSGNLLWMGETLNRNNPDYRNVRDLATGKIVKEYPNYDGWVDYHHHRCYRDKATMKYILAGRTGVEFIDLETGELTPHNWIRGNCKNGIIPANGLLYKPPDQCGCFIESKLTGLNGLAPKRAIVRELANVPRFEKGPAFNKVKGQTPESGDKGDWPTYRADASRSGSTAVAVSSSLKRAWTTKLGCKLTQPVVANGRLFVASIDDHTLHALDASNGDTVWTYAAGGRIDSSPTVADGFVVFGCRDGWVYALRDYDGALVWRFRAAPDELNLVADEQVESVWPVHGSVLVQDGAVYCAAGRSSYLDGGVAMYKLDLATGRVLVEKRFNSRDPKTGRTVFLYEPFKTNARMATREMPGVLPDILSSDGENIWMRVVTFNRDIEIQEEDIPHLFSWSGFLDDTWYERTYWIYGDHFYSSMVGIKYAKSIVPSGRIMVFDDKKVYGYQDETFARQQSDVSMFSMSKQPKFGKSKRRSNRKATQTPSSLVYDWRSQTSLYPNAIVLAGDTIFVAGPPRFDEEKTRAFLETNRTDDHAPVPMLQEALDTFEGRRGAVLLAINKTDGQKIAEYKLDASPIFDGLIAANGNLYMSTKLGTVVCMAEVR